MNFIRNVASAITLLAGFWLIGLALVALIKPDSARSFLGGFASSAFTHFLEIFLRIIVGSAFVIHSPTMNYSAIFNVFGWLLVATSVVLLFVPWKLHRRFADWSLPMVTRWMKLFGLVSAVAGILILFSFFSASDSRSVTRRFYERYIDIDLGTGKFTRRDNSSDPRGAASDTPAASLPGKVVGI